MFFKKFLYEDIQFFLLNTTNLIIKGIFGKAIINLAQYYGFIRCYDFLNFSFLFVNKIMYNNFMKYFFRMYFFVLKVFFFKLRLRGLGYRMIRLAPRLLRFFFAKNHFYYFYVPYSFFIKIKRRNFFVFCYQKSLLNDLFHHFMLLKKLDLYEKTNSFILKNKILFLKKRK